MIICHVCGRPLATKARDFGERAAGEIRPRGGKSRYYCAPCWYREIEINKEARKGVKNA